MLSVVAFDYYGTLEDIHTVDRDIKTWEILSGFMRYHGAEYEPEHLWKRFYQLLEEEKHRLGEECGHAYFETDEQLVWEQLYRDRGVEPDRGQVLATAEIFRAGTTEYYRLYPGIRDLLRNVREMGKRTALFSNAQSIYTLPEIHSLGIWDCFDALFISSDYGVRKPSERFYKRLLDWAHIPPENILMVGNNPRDDIEPAKRLGLKTCYVHSNLTEQGAAMPKTDFYLEWPDTAGLLEIIQKA